MWKKFRQSTTYGLWATVMIGRIVGHVLEATGVPGLGQVGEALVSTLNDNVALTATGAVGVRAGAVKIAAGMGKKAE